MIIAARTLKKQEDNITIECKITHVVPVMRIQEDITIHVHARQSLGRRTGMPEKISGEDYVTNLKSGNI